MCASKRDVLIYGCIPPETQRCIPDSTAAEMKAIETNSQFMFIGCLKHCINIKCGVFFLHKLNYKYITCIVCMCLYLIAALAGAGLILHKAIEP